MPEKRAFEALDQQVPGKKSRLPNQDRFSGSCYRSLDVSRQEIRLLILEPGTTDDDIKCTFTYTSLVERTSTPYETISYVWGDASVRGTITLHGQCFDIPSSSETVLRRLRDLHTCRTIWIDAICIDQDDVAERAEQVAMMGTIYSRCFHNLIWLGEDDGTTGAALASLQAINHERVSMTNNESNLVELYYPGGTIITSSRGLQVRVRESAIRRFFGSAWFSRLWVVQEAALAPRSTCLRGAFEIPLIDVLQAALWIRFTAVGDTVSGRLSRSTGVIAACDLADWTVQGSGYHVSRPLQGRVLAALLASLRDFKSKDPRDHVFALLGLWLAKSDASKLPNELLPDYTAPLSQVLLNATRFAIRERGDLEILKLVSHQPNAKSLADLPAWVPRWDQGYDISIDPQPLTHRGSRADAGRELDVKEALGDIRVLSLRGFSIGTVASCIPEMREKRSRSFRAYVAAVEQTVNQSHKGDIESLYGKVGMALQAGTMISSDVATESQSGRAYLIYKRALTNIDSANPYHSSSMSTMSASAQKRIAAEFASGMISACYDRNFFSTATGLFGLGPKTMKSGDLVAIVYGSPFPVAARSRPGYESQYEFLGVCYVYGIMQGEAVKHHQESGNDDVLFQLV